MDAKQNMPRRVMILSLIILFFVSLSTVNAKAVPLMTKEELKPLIGNPDVVVLDVRLGKDWKSSEFKIKDAQHANPKEFKSWANKYPKDKKLVLYCA